MEFIEGIRNKAKQNPRRVVYPEGTDERVIKAARFVLDEKIASSVTLIGNEDDVKSKAKELNINIDDVEIVDPISDKDWDNYVEVFYELRKHKGMTIEKAKKRIQNELYYAALMLRDGRVDLSVGGAVNTTGDVIRAAAQVLGMKENVDVISSSFFMVVPDFLGTGENKVLVFGDCAVVPNPTKEQLASIAYSCANMYKKVIGDEPKVAMLSFSTKGSAAHEMVFKVREATQIAKERYSDLKIDGELQFDAAIIPEIAKRKAPDSEVAGEANVFIFPDLNAGNIGYKLVERLAKAKAIGPVMQGVAKPFMDLSRGCSWEDIVNVTSIASLLVEE